MRITPEQVAEIRRIVREALGDEATVRLFGSRLDDSARGGDVDLLIEVPGDIERPALIGAQLAGRVSRALHGRHVDVVLAAANLRPLPIHTIARQTGQLL